VITGLGLLLTGLNPTFAGARWGRFLAGVGGAGANVPAMALVSSWFGTRRRGLATGAGVAGSSVGLMVTGPLIPMILARYGAEGWRVSWYVLGAMAILVAGLCALFLRNRPEEKGETPIGETEMECQSRTLTRSRAPLDWSAIWRSGRLWHLAGIYFAFGFSYIIYSTFFVRYLVSEGHFSSRDAGSVWMKIGLVSMASGFIWGGLSDRWGRRLALLGVFVVQGSSFLVLGLSPAWPAVYLSAGLFALTAWSVPALMAALAGDVFGPRLAPAALGLMTIVFGLGQAAGPFLAGKLADTFQTFSPAFIIAGCVALLGGAGGSWWLSPTPEQLRPRY
jgi:MFS family permease